MKEALLLLLVAGVAQAQVGRQTCEATCTGAAAPTCPRCEPGNVCSDLYHTDRAAYDACMAKIDACYQEASDCTTGVNAGVAARDACSANESCCASACAGDLSPPHETSRAWLYVDFLGALELRNTSLSFAGGGEIELLAGKPAWHGDVLQPRAGPFVSFVIDNHGAIDAALGLSVLAWGRVLAHDPGFARALLVSGGAVLDRPADGSSSPGVLARVAYGVTSVRQSTWKPVSGWLYAEVDVIPVAPVRASVFFGVRLGPLGALFLLIPGAGDP